MKDKHKLLEMFNLIIVMMILINFLFGIPLLSRPSQPASLLWGLCFVVAFPQDGKKSMLTSSA